MMTVVVRMDSTGNATMKKCRMLVASYCLLSVRFAVKELSDLHICVYRDNEEVNKKER